MKHDIPPGVHVTYAAQRRTCGSPTCHCRRDGGHPNLYTYAIWRDPETQRMRSAYVGVTTEAHLAIIAAQKFTKRGRKPKAAEVAA